MTKSLLRSQFESTPPDWQLIPLKRLMRVYSGKEVPLEVPPSETAVPVYGSGADPFKYTVESISDKPSILFGRKGTLGQPYIVEPPFWAVDTAYIGMPQKGMDIQYLNYLLQVFDWQPFITNTAKPSLVANDILPEKVPVPTESERIRILHFLAQKSLEIDGLVGKLQREAALLEQYRCELIAHTVTRGLDHNAEMHESGVEWIGTTPATWRLLRISALYDLRSTKVSDKQYPPLSVTKNGVVPQLDSVAKTDDGDNRRLIRAGDFVINSRSDRRGACGIAPQDGSCSLINIVLAPQESIYNPYFSYLFGSAAFSDEFYRWGHGIHDDLWTTNWIDMKSIQVPVPPVGEQIAIAKYLDDKLSEIDLALEHINRQIELLGIYRKQVINDAVTGKIRIGEVA